jgi:wingless-type MMTV integration site family protein 6
MGELVECSCDKNLVRHNVLLNGNNVLDGSTQMTPFETTRSSNRNRSKKPRRNGNKQLRKANKRKAPMMPEFPGMGETWEWSGCDDNVNFGNRKSKDFLDSRFRRRSDIKTLVRIQNNDAGRLVSFWEI